MSLADLDLIGCEIVDKTLIVDADIIVYRPCCVFNEDDDMSRRQIGKYINLKLDELMEASECTKYILFFTTKFNFRDDLVDDYKGNRADVERPVNLTWAKRWAMDNLNSFYHKGLEADDLLGIHMKDDTVLWSLDKDLRQIPGQHLDDATQKIITITEEGKLEDRGKKVYFDGTVGFHYQLLIGDSTDHIVGCGKRVEAVYKSGAKKGETYIKRQGIGPKAALKIITEAAIAKGSKPLLEATLNAVVEKYKDLWGGDWQKHLETQAQLLFMIREQDGDKVNMWTYDNRDAWFDLSKGVFLDG